jgi:hypothetical protein
MQVLDAGQVKLPSPQLSALLDKKLAAQVGFVSSLFHLPW